MSNTSRVIPYAAACIRTVAAGTAAFARWLAEETPADRAAIERFRAERRRERLRGASARGRTSTRPPGLTTARVHLQDPVSLVRSAEKLGYRVAAPPDPADDGSAILLASASGERLAIGRDGQGGLAIHTAGDHHRVHALVRQHTMDQVVEHLRGKGMCVQMTVLPNGEVQIHARERVAGRGGAAHLKTQVHSDGTASVDIAGIQGSRCAEITSRLADAMGGRICDVKRKDSYYLLRQRMKKEVRI